MENVKWLDVVLDYGKRCPNVTMNDIFGKQCKSYKISDMILWEKSGKCFKIITSGTEDNHIRCFTTTKYQGRGDLLYFNVKKQTWFPISQNILLRLLTEGKEDLI